MRLSVLLVSISSATGVEVGTQQQPATPQQLCSCAAARSPHLHHYCATLERYQSDTQEVLLLVHHSIPLFLPSRAPAQTGRWHFT